MDKAQTKSISEHISTLEQMQADIEAIRDEMTEKFEAKSEKWQESEAGEAAQEKINEVNAVIDQMDALTSDLSGLINS